MGFFVSRSKHFFSFKDTSRNLTDPIKERKNVNAFTYDLLHICTYGLQYIIIHVNHVNHDSGGVGPGEPTGVGMGWGMGARNLLVVGSK